MSASKKEDIQRELLAGAVQLTLYGVTFNVARTPIGKGLSAYMSLIDRRKKTIWDKLEKLEAEAGEDKSDEFLLKKQQIVNDALMANQEADSEDMIEALYWSIVRVDPTIDRDTLRSAIDGGNQEEVFSALVNLNTVRKINLPNSQTPAAGETATASENLTPTTGATS